MQFSKISSSNLPTYARRFTEAFRQRSLGGQAADSPAATAAAVALRLGIAGGVGLEGGCAESLERGAVEEQELMEQRRARRWVIRQREGKLGWSLPLLEVPYCNHGPPAIMVLDCHVYGI